MSMKIISLVTSLVTKIWSLARVKLDKIPTGIFDGGQNCIRDKS